MREFSKLCWFATAALGMLDCCRERVEATLPRALPIKISSVVPAEATSSYNCHMLIRKASDVRSSEITPKDVYLRRREFIQASAAALVAAGCGSLQSARRRRAPS